MQFWSLDRVKRRRGIAGNNKREGRAVSPVEEGGDCRGRSLLDGGNDSEGRPFRIGTENTQPNDREKMLDHATTWLRIFS